MINQTWPIFDDDDSGDVSVQVGQNDGLNRTMTGANGLEKKMATTRQNMDDVKSMWNFDIRIYSMIYMDHPIDPCFDWSLGPSFGGL